ncbi:Uu.00g146170.m01.CDS01 [Anthostomella pinea]|uniref:Uu.00g146170.m01.CDS01 n=1 Tax=Anthostomella pinea TaxID=933095 RepID=A0AAI8VR92_9PEZI|nr:Uu.00g146170.m01.CDS01 [Anthostomella pinea]
MSLSSNDQAAMAPSQIVEHTETNTHSNMPAIVTQDGTREIEAAHSPDFSLDSNEDAAGEAEDATPDADRGQEHIPRLDTTQTDTIQTQHDVSNTHGSARDTATSETMTQQYEAAASSHDLASATPTQPAPESAADASSSTDQQPQESQDIMTTDDVQPPQESNNEAAIDIQALVDNITARAAEDASQDSVAQDATNNPTTAQTSSLPPRPPMPQQPATQSYAQPQDLPTYPAGDLHPGSAMTMPPTMPPALGTYPARAPGTSAESSISLPPFPPSTSAMHNTPMSMPQHDGAYTAAPSGQPQPFGHQQQQQWDGFLQEERRYVSEAKWDRFPDGSRLFIGNLSSERVSKKEVFDIFARYGRLAQISLKQAYGFVQYHTVDEGQAAMENLQGTEIRGRKIHLEFSRTQKKDGDGDKRGNRGKRDGERSDRREGGRGRRDDYRPGRQPSPKRGSQQKGNSQDGNHNGRGRGNRDGGFKSGRGRSRSPSFGGRDAAQYRRRSPSPPRRYPADMDLDMPRRYGGDIPDVQFLLLQEVEREFVSWAEQAFINQGLKVLVMFLNPQFPREAVIQRQVVEGVHAVVELDIRAQQLGMVSFQVFDRSAGHNVRYDQYQDLDPNVAAQLVARTKAQSQLPSPYGTGQLPPAQQYPHAHQAPYMPPHYPNQPYPGHTMPPGPVGPGGSLDNATLQKILGTLHGQPGGHHMPGQPMPPGGAPAAMNGLQGGIGGGHHAHTPQHAGVGYPPAPANGAPGGHGGDSSHHVHNIMAQLSRYR